MLRRSRAKSACALAVRTRPGRIPKVASLKPFLFASVLFALAACGGPPPGCPHDLPTSCPATVPSYQSQVAPLIQGNCGGCHGNFRTYPDVFTSRQAMENAVVSCGMPRGRTMSTADRQTLLAWFVCGAPQN